MKIMKKYEDPDKKLLKEQSKNTMNLVYGREYEDDESISEPYFYSYSTVYRNMDIDLNKKAKLEAKFPKMKAYFDKNYINTVGGEKDAKEVSNFTGNTKLEIIFGDEYYETFGDRYSLNSDEEDYMDLYNDYGQLFNGRQFFKKDYNTELTNKYKKGEKTLWVN